MSHDCKKHENEHAYNENNIVITKSFSYWAISNNKQKEKKRNMASCEASSCSDFTRTEVLLFDGWLMKEVNGCLTGGRGLLTLFVSFIYLQSIAVGNKLCKTTLAQFETIQTLPRVIPKLNSKPKKPYPVQKLCNSQNAILWHRFNVANNWLLLFSQSNFLVIVNFTTCFSCNSILRLQITELSGNFEIYEY